MTFGVVKLSGPIVPDPLVKLTDVVPITVPAVRVMAPEVEAVSVATVP